MKTVAAMIWLVMPAVSGLAATTIDSTNHFAYGANIGWLEGRGDMNQGAVIGEYVCSGFIYSANVGWISLGSGAPANGIYYQNALATDFGLNQDGAGNLRGYAYGANIGWIAFETNGVPRVDLQTGKLSGYAWSANCGWISLSNAVASVQTDTIARGVDANLDGLPDAWELQNFGTINLNVNADPDHDGQSNLQEYLAGTNPNDGDDCFRITYVARTNLFTTLEWTSEATRSYTVQFRPALDISSRWMDSISPGFGVSNATFTTGFTNTPEFYRIRACRPLMP
jgi:hypothetical protein